MGLEPTQVPFTHVSVSVQAFPSLQTEPLMHEQFSFGVPLHESSFPLSQLSLAAGDMLHDPQIPPAHRVIPPAHVPRAPRALPHVALAPLMHAHPPGGLFGTPSQLLSLRLSHVSLLGLMLHAPHAPLAQVVVPVAQGPTSWSAVAQLDIVPLRQVQP